MANNQRQRFYIQGGLFHIGYSDRGNRNMLHKEWLNKV